MDLKNNLEALGYNSNHEAFRIEQNLDITAVGRVIAEHKERYIVKTALAETEAEITGNMRFAANGREDFPAVGDWVALTSYDPDFAVIHSIFPRFSVLKRQAAGQSGEIQIIATNIDYAFLVQASDRDFSINRLERYLTICHASNVSPIILISKTDLADEQRVGELTASIQLRISDVPVIALSNQSERGYGEIKQIIGRGKTYCLLGSSGVGKSTLLNNLAGRSIMKTNSISQSTSKGRHVTTHRELVVLDGGGLLIDNPGMREVGIADTTSGLETTFDRIIRLAEKCRFKDCTHTNEAGCLVLDSVEKGEIEKREYENFQRLEREKTHYESTVEERRRKDKDFGKMLKNYKKDMKKNMY
jgi:ribosome biogenesis GTPase / thiamine phosphate phosphatase